MIQAMFYGAALVALLLAFLPALDFLNFKPFGDRRNGAIGRVLFGLFADELGAVTVTYYVRSAGVQINGSTTGPTTTQGSVTQKQVATCAFGATADAQALFTHNMGLDASSPTYFDLEVLWEPTTTNTYCPLITFDRTNTNVLKVNKPATDAPATILVTIRRPHSAGQ